MRQTVVKELWAPAVVAVLALALTATQAMPQAECNVLKIAESYIAEQFPGSVSSDMKPVISKQGDSWVVTYELPIYMLGGSPVITVDKRACKVIDAYRTQ